MSWIKDDARVLWNQYESLELDADISSRKFYHPDGTVVKYRQIVVPSSLQDSFIQLLHEKPNYTVMTHLSSRKTQEHLRLRAYWVGWRASVEWYCGRCVTCQ